MIEDTIFKDAMVGLIIKWEREFSESNKKYKSTFITGNIDLEDIAIFFLIGKGVDVESAGALVYDEGFGQTLKGIR